jgi:DNA-binding SARP family transcriptional activator/class 3 adenylate cyclase
VSCLSLYLLGPPRVERDGVPIKVDTRKAIALLAYVAITGESHRRDALVNLLWPESDQSRGRAALRRTLSALRKALADDWLDVDRETIGLSPSADIWLDVAQFHAHLAECLAHGHATSEVCPACLTPLTDAVELYRGDLLSGFTLKDSFNFDDWQFFQADALRRELAGALERLVRCHSDRGEFEAAIGYARQWLELDRLDEAAHCALMRLYSWSSQRSAALRQYQECVRILGSALGVSPQEPTTALHDAIQEGRAPAPPVAPHVKRPATGREREAPPHPEAPPAVLDEGKRIVTAICADMSGSFRRMGDVDSEDEAALIRRFLEVVEGGLARYGGQVDRILGGRVLGVFGTTGTHESDPELAIRAAIEMRKEAERLGLRVTAGINTGEVYFGGAGAVEHRGFTVMGTVIDRAARLAGRARAGQILVDESTYRLTWRAFEFTALSLDIKGVEGPVAAYQVERLLPRPEKARGIEGLRADLIGRDEEFGKLKEALAGVLEGRGQMVTLVGEAGVGKSRLVAELKEVVFSLGDDQPTPLWLEGRCLERGTAASYTPFIDIFRGYFAWGAQDDDHRRRERIISSLLEMAERGDLSEERVEEMVPLLSRLLSVRLEDEWEARLRGDSPEQIRRRTFVAVHDFFFALSGRQPVVLVFEDLHWADSLSLDLLPLLMDGLHLGPLLLLCVHRPVREHRCRHLRTIAAQKCGERYVELRLRELSHRQSQQLVESLLAMEDLPSAVRDLILDRSQGNPFFIEEVVHSLIDAGVVYRENGSWRAREAIDSMVVPQSVQSVILGRVDRLDGNVKRVLQAGSVIGRVFRRQVLAHAMQQQQEELEDALWELQDRALVYQERTIPEEEYSFKHVLTQETVYHNILHSRREAIHGQVAEAIEVLYQDSLAEYYEQLAYHYEKAGNAEKAVEYLQEAGEKARRSSANEVAIAHLTRGLELLKTLPETPEHIQRELDMQIALGVPLVLTKGHAAAEVERAYARARELSRQMGETRQRFQVLLGLERSFLHRGALETAHELGEQLLTLAQSTQSPSHLSRAHMMIAEILYYLGEFAQILDHCQQGIALCDPQQRRSHIFLYGNDTEIGCRILEAECLWYLGYPDQALERIDRMLNLAQELSHPFTLVFALYFAAALYQLCRDVQAVQQRVEKALGISAEQGFALYLAWGAVLRGWVLAERGQEDDGIDQIRQGIAARQSTMRLPNAFAFLAEAYGKVGQVEEGLSVLAEALDRVDGSGERCWEAELHRLKGELLLQRGEGGGSLRDAELCFQRALEVARRQQAKSWELRAATSLGRLWERQGKRDRARAQLQEVYGWFTEGFDTPDLKEAQALLDALA